MDDLVTARSNPILPAGGQDRLDLGLSILAGLTVLGCSSLVATFSFGRDQSIYAVVADGILQGAVPYRDLWDFKPPGIFFVFAGAQALFGRSMAAARILEALGLVAMALAMLRLSTRWFNSSLPGWLGAAIASVVHLELDFWHSGQPESFGGMLTVFAILSAITAAESSTPRRYWLLSGVLWGSAALLKPPLGGGALVIAAYLLLLQPNGMGKVRRSLPVLVLGLGALLPLIACGLWFWHRGGWAAMVWTLRDFVPGYTALGWQKGQLPLEMLYFAAVEMLTRFSAFIPVGLVALLLLRARSAREREGISLLLGVAFVHAAGIALQAKFFQYHYAGTTPLLALAAGVGWYKLWRWVRGRRPAGMVLAPVVVAILLLMQKPIRDVPGTVPERSLARLRYLLHLAPYTTRAALDAALHRAADFDLVQDRQVADYLRQRTSPRESILVWGFEPAIYWLAERPAATRFIYDVPQRSAWQVEISRRIFLSEVKTSAPSFIVVQYGDVFPGVTGKPTDSAQDLQEFPELARYVHAGYQHQARLQDFDIYARVPPSARQGQPLHP